MSDWFCNVPTRLADALGATKFQFETLARLVQYYKTRCGQQKIIMDRMKNEIEAVKELKRCAVGLQVYGNLDTDMHQGDGGPPVGEPVSSIWNAEHTKHPKR